MATTTPRAREQRAREAVERAIGMLAHARSKATWCHGYCAGGKDSPEIRAKQMAWWGRVEKEEAELKRALASYRRANREAAK